MDCACKRKAPSIIMGATVQSISTVVLSGYDTLHRSTAGCRPLCSAAVYVSTPILPDSRGKCKSVSPKSEKKGLPAGPHARVRRSPAPGVRRAAPHRRAALSRPRTEGAALFAARPRPCCGNREGYRLKTIQTFGKDSCIFPLKWYNWDERHCLIFLYDYKEEQLHGKVCLRIL